MPSARRASAESGSLAKRVRQLSEVWTDRMSENAACGGSRATGVSHVSPPRHGRSHASNASRNSAASIWLLDQASKFLVGGRSPVAAEYSGRDLHVKPTRAGE